MVLTVPCDDSDEEDCAPRSHGDDHTGGDVTLGMLVCDADSDGVHL